MRTTYSNARSWDAAAEPGDARANQQLTTDTLHGGVDVVDRLAAEWRMVCAEGAKDEPFFRPEWIAAYLRAFEPESRLRVITARRGGRLRAVLPLVAQRTWKGGLPVAVLRSPTNAHSGRFDLVHGSDDETSAVEAVWASLKTAGAWDMLVFRDVPDGGALASLVSRARSEGYPIASGVTQESPYIRLPGRNGRLEAAFAQTDAKFRANVRRRLRKLEGEGPVRLVRIESPEPEALDRFYRLEQSGWKGNDGTAIACDARVRRFYDEMAKRAAEFGYFSLYELECGGRPVAAHYGLTYGERYFVPKLAYDEGYGQYGPGQLIMHEIVRDLVDRGLREFDFLGQSMAWKREWTRDARLHRRYYVFNTGLVGRLLYATVVQARSLAGRVKRRLVATSVDA